MPPDASLPGGETPDSIAAEGIPDPDKPVLKGGGRQVVKTGGMHAANGDFDRLMPTQVETRPNGVRIGRLADGSTIIARPFSEPTLEVQADRKPRLKIRYRS